MLPRHLDLNLLRVFDVLMEERNVTAAARRLNITQPSASNALDRLRDSLNDPLLVRQGRRMVPTRHAEQLWPIVHDALNQLNKGIGQLQTFDPATLDTQLHIGLDAYANAAFGAAVATRILTEAPNCRINLLPLPVDAWGLKPQLDIAIGTVWQPSFTMQRKALWKEDFVVVMRSDHPGLEDQSQISFETYIDARHLLLSDRGIVGGTVDGALRKINAKRKTFLSSSLFETLSDVLSQTDCVATMGRTIATKLVERGELTMMPPPIFIEDFEVSLAWHQRNQNSPVLNWLKDLCARSITEN